MRDADAQYALLRDRATTSDRPLLIHQSFVHDLAGVFRALVGLVGRARRTAERSAGGTTPGVA